MSNSVSYNYVPNQSVYVINTLGPNNQWPYWGFPCGNFGAGFNGFNNGQGAYPNGFTSSTPAIQSGQVLQSRIMFTVNNPTVPTIMYDIRVTGELGTTSFPENMVFPATPGTAGAVVVDYGAILTAATPIVLATNTYRTTIYINGSPTIVSLDLSLVPNFGSLVALMNAQLGTTASVSIIGGNLKVASGLIGATSTIFVTEPLLPGLFESLPGYIGFHAPTAGMPSGLDQATAFYETLNL